MIKSFAVDLDTLLTVAAAVLDSDAILLEANPGFLRLLPADHGPRIGTRISRFFIQPKFAALVKALDVDPAVGYRGLLTLGNVVGVVRTLRGRVWRSELGIQFLAEYDIEDLERLMETVLDLNHDSSVAQHALTSANVGLEKREEQIVEQSLTDALTGVGNRRKLEQALPLEIGRARRGGTALSALMTDVDHFKRVNDVYGHGAGDEVLARLGELLRSNTRPTDIVARFGGEEFVVLMPHASLVQALSRAEQIRVALSAETIAPLPTPVTASFGVAELKIEEDGESLLRRADRALYQAKEGGRNRVVADPGGSDAIEALAFDADDGRD